MGHVETWRAATRREAGKGAMMHEILAVVYQISGQRWGTAQDLTFGIPMGITIALTLASLFAYRSGHERAHRIQVLREQRREELSHQRPQQLEALHDEPHIEEGAPR